MQVRRFFSLVVVVVLATVTLVSAAPQGEGETPAGDPPGPEGGSPEPVSVLSKLAKQRRTKQ